jgi:hypothetical protein
MMATNGSLNVEIYDSSQEKILAHSIFIFRNTIKEIAFEDIFFESKSLLERYYHREVKTFRIYLRIQEVPNESFRLVELDLLQKEKENQPQLQPPQKQKQKQSIPNGATIILEVTDYPFVLAKRSYYNFSLSWVPNSSNTKRVFVSSSV